MSGALGGIISKYLTGSLVQKLLPVGVGALGGFLGAQWLSPPRTQTVYQALPGSYQSVTTPSQQSSGGTDLLGSLSGILPIALLFLLLPRLMGGGSSGTSGASGGGVTVIESPGG